MEAERACTMALEAAYSPSASPLQSAIPSDGEMEPLVMREGPMTASQAQQAFREAFTGPIVTTPTFNFVSAIVGDRAAASQFRYDRVYALGLSVLCDAFLP